MIYMILRWSPPHKVRPSGQEWINENAFFPTMIPKQRIATELRKTLSSRRLLIFLSTRKDLLRWRRFPKPWRRRQRTTSPVQTCQVFTQSSFVPCGSTPCRASRSQALRERCWEVVQLETRRFPVVRSSGGCPLIQVGNVSGEEYFWSFPSFQVCAVPLIPWIRWRTQHTGCSLKRCRTISQSQRKKLPAQWEGRRDSNWSWTYIQTTPPLEQSLTTTMRSMSSLEDLRSSLYSEKEAFSWSLERSIRWSFPDRWKILSSFSRQVKVFLKFSGQVKVFFKFSGQVKVFLKFSG